MATPLNKVYPAENRQLANEILDNGGCWISELPLWGKFHKSSFVQRDRIQSGLSVAVIPVQTDVEGGTMHTVRYAEQQGRLVLCPRPIEAEQRMKQYAGIRNLIDTGRAEAFSSHEYTVVLQTLVERRRNLLKGVPTEPKAEIPIPKHAMEQSRPLIDIAASAEKWSPKGTAASEVKEGTRKRERRSRLQSGFDFIEEPASPKSKKPSKKQRELEIRILEQLRDEISTHHLGGEPILTLDDVTLRLDKRIKALREQA
jgi:predicted Rossmann fold nucleotide-binding protein DprA/Smf involved in DNA uptake